ncbi:BamA/TamA family outer membrane protein [Aliiroseovarius sp. N1Y82]|uniref:autotransporter assembly complex protein TamA n=1 Tax=Aliiroseovarius subalbicans TaxID=2925840 RepID=UPI001F5639A0|nr:BamA/TamA family outer membrane protein [Aliiroseovarius subalbicans]
MFLLALATGSARAFTLQFTVASDDPGLRGDLEAASLVANAKRDGVTAPRDVLAAALADYARLLRSLYANGHYSGVIQILLDGREAATIPAFQTPTAIDAVVVKVDPGPAFRFGAATIAPLAPKQTPLPGFRSGARAYSGVLQDSVDSAVDGWRHDGHAKARLSRQQVTADHRAHTLTARLQLSPGPLVRFGALRLTGESTARSDRVARIAGLPSGQVFSPDELEKVAARLRRTGSFSSVSLVEADELGEGNSMDIELALVDAKPRRFGFGAEISTFDGLSLSGYWLHRNLLGGAERFRIDGEITGIGGETGGIDYDLNARLDIPAAFGTDINAFVFAGASYVDDPVYQSWQARLGGGVSWILSDTLTAELGVALRHSRTRDGSGDRTYTLLTLPAGATWDRRDNQLNPKAGTFLDLLATPFVGLGGTGTGLQLTADGRAYHGFGAGDRVVLAGRLQAGAAYGSNATAVPAEFLFFSGGGGSVRGHPYQSLGIDLGGGNFTGGKAFLAGSAELRANVTQTIGLVGFVDAGFIGAHGFGDMAWHAGAGVGVRYDTGIGPIRLDVATPIHGTTGQGVQIYVGIGQAF